MSKLEGRVISRTLTEPGSDVVVTEPEPRKMYVEEVVLETPDGRIQTVYLVVTFIDGHKLYYRGPRRN